MASAPIAIAMMLACTSTGALATQPSCAGQECLDVDRQDEFSVLQVGVHQHKGLDRQGALDEARWKDRAGKEWKNDRAFQAEILATHNKLRALHGAAPLTWCASCAKDAEKAATQCANTRTFGHSNHAGQGQNAASATPPRSPAQSVQAWYDELTDYNYATGQSKNGKAIGHFTQVVWCGTTEVGCAASSAGNYMFCNYKAAGNVLGHYQDNVPAVGGNCGGQSNSRSNAPQQPRNRAPQQQQRRSSSGNKQPQVASSSSNKAPRGSRDQPRVVVNARDQVQRSRPAPSSRSKAKWTGDESPCTAYLAWCDRDHPTCASQKSGMRCSYVTDKRGNKIIKANDKYCCGHNER